MKTATTAAPQRRSTDQPKTHARKVPPMSGELREWMTGVLDDEYNRGRIEGVRDMIDNAIWRETGMFVGGILVSVLAQFAWHWVTR